MEDGAPWRMEDRRTRRTEDGLAGWLAGWRTEDGGWRTWAEDTRQDRGWRPEDGGWGTEDRGQRTEDGGRRTYAYAFEIYLVHPAVFRKCAFGAINSPKSSVSSSRIFSPDYLKSKNNLLRLFSAISRLIR